MKHTNLLWGLGLLFATSTTFLFSSCSDDDESPIETAEKEQGVSVSGIVNGHTYVDLGLPSGLKWATYNLGASLPSQTGDRYAWGETQPKEEYRPANYKWSQMGDDIMTKYNADDMLTELQAEDDAATVNWGPLWRMPKESEFNELLDGCDWVWTEDFNGTGVAGKIGTSKTNGKTIFLPVTLVSESIFNPDELFKSGMLWSSTLGGTVEIVASELNYTKDYTFCGAVSRFGGEGIRAVME